MYRGPRPLLDREQQLQALVALLEHHQVDWWLETGSLLGIRRDGELLEHDKDIDFGCWSDQLPRLRSLVADLRNEGYHIALHGYQGRLHQVKARPPLGALLNGVRTADFAVFRRTDEVAWCPVDCVMPQPHRRFSLAWAFEKPVREAVFQSWRRDQGRGVRTWPLPRLRLEVRTWVVPVAHFLRRDLTNWRGVELRTPCEVDSYLRFRYGDWQQPTTSWDYCEDDGAIVAQVPERAVGL